MTFWKPHARSAVLKLWISYRLLFFFFLDFYYFVIEITARVFRLVWGTLLYLLIFLIALFIYLRPFYLKIQREVLRYGKIKFLFYFFSFKKFFEKKNFFWIPVYIFFTNQIGDKLIAYHIITSIHLAKLVIRNELKFFFFSREK